MDNSLNLPLNILESDTMGNILQSTNESKDPASENRQKTATDSEALSVSNIEVSNQQSLASNSFKNVAPDASLSKDVESVDEWLQGDAKHLVKVEADEDFEGIVKSLETAIVETQNYDLETGFSSRASSSVSNIRSVSDSDGILTSESLMGELSKDLNRSPQPQFVEVETEEPVILDTGLDPIEALTDNSEFISVSSEVAGNFIAIEEDMANFSEDQTNDLFHNSAENDFSGTELSALGLPSTMSADIPVEIGQGLLRQRTVNIRNNLEIDPELSESSIIYSTGDEATNDGILNLNPTSELKKSSSETHEQNRIFSSRLEVKDNAMEVHEISLRESNIDFKSEIIISKKDQVMNELKIEATEKYVILEEKLINESIVEEEIPCESAKEATEKYNPSDGTSQQTKKVAVLEDEISNKSTSEKIEEHIALEKIITSKSTAEVCEEDDILKRRINNESTAEDNLLEDKIASDLIAEKFEKDISYATTSTISEESVIKESLAENAEKKRILEERISYESPPVQIENNVILDSATEEMKKQQLLKQEISSKTILEKTKKYDEFTATITASCSKSIPTEQESVELSKLVLKQDANMELQIEPEILDEEKIATEESIDKNIGLKLKENSPNMETGIQEPESLREEDLAINALLDESIEDSTHELELDEEEVINFNREDQGESISMREEDIAIRSLFTHSAENSNSPPVYPDENIENDTTDEQRDILQLREEEIAIRNLLTESANDSVESNIEFEQEDNILSIEEALEEPEEPIQVPDKQLKVSNLLIKSVETCDVPESEMEIEREKNIINEEPLESEQDIAVRNLLTQTNIEFKEENSMVQDVAIEQDEPLLLTEEQIAVNNLLAQCNIETEEDTILQDYTSTSERHTANNENVVIKEILEVSEIAEDTVIQDSILEDSDVVLDNKKSKISTDQSNKIITLEEKVQDVNNSDNKVHESINFKSSKQEIEKMDTTVTKEIQSNINKEADVARGSIFEIEDKPPLDLLLKKADKNIDEKVEEHSIYKMNVLTIENEDMFSDKSSQKLGKKFNEPQKSDPIIYEKNIQKPIKYTIEKDNKSSLLISDKILEKPICELGENIFKSDTIIVKKTDEYFKDIVEKSKPSTSHIAKKIAQTSTKMIENPMKSNLITSEKISDQFSKSSEEAIVRNTSLDLLISEKLSSRYSENIDKSEKSEKGVNTLRENLEENVEKNKKSQPLISEKIAEKLREIEEMEMHDEQIEKSTSYSPQKVKLIRQRFPKVGAVKVQSIKPQTASYSKKVDTVQASKPDVITEVQKPVVLSEVPKPADNLKTEIKELESQSNSPKCNVPEEKPVLDETKLAIIEQFLEESEDEIKTPVKPQKLKLKRNYQPPSTIVKPNVIKEIIPQKKNVTEVIQNPKNDLIIVKKEEPVTLQSTVPEAVPVNVKKAVEVLGSKKESITLQSGIPEAMQSKHVKNDVEALCLKKDESIILQSTVSETVEDIKNNPVIVKKDVEALCLKKDEIVRLQLTVPETIEDVKSNPVIVKENVGVLCSKKEEPVALQSTIPETVEDMENNTVIVKSDVEVFCSKKEESVTLHSTEPEIIRHEKNNPVIVEALSSKKEESATMQSAVPETSVEKSKAIVCNSPGQKESEDSADKVQSLTERSEIIDIVEKPDSIMTKIDVLPANSIKTDITISEEVKITETIKEVKVHEKEITINPVEIQSSLISKIPEVVDARVTDTIKEFKVTEIQDDVDNSLISEENVPVKDEIQDDAIIDETFETNELENLNVTPEDNILSEHILGTSDSNDAANVINQLKIIDVFTIEDKSSSVDLSDRINTASPEIENVEIDESGPLSVVENLPGIQFKKITTSQTESSSIHFPLLMSRLQDKLDAATKTSKASKQETSSKQKAALVELPHIEIKPEQVVLPTISAHISPRSKEITKLRSSQKRKHSPDVSSKQAITKPLSVEVDDLETSDANYETAQYSLTPTQKEHENLRKIVMKHIPRPEKRSSPKITIKPIKPPSSPELSSKKMKHGDESSPTRLTIKSSNKQEPLKITFTKQKTDDTHSILKIYQPEDYSTAEDMHVPRMTIKPPKQKSDEMQHSPKITIKPVKPPISPKVTVKHILPPSDSGSELTTTPKSSSSKLLLEESYPKVTIKPVLKPEESHKSSQLTPRQIKLKSMTFDSSSGVTVEPVCSTSSSFPSHKFDQESHIKMSSKSYFISEESSTSKLSIKPITKTCEIVQSDLGSSSPLKLTIKPLKSEESYQSPKITIKPIVKPDDLEEIEKPERIILKIQKTNLHSPKERSSTHVKESKREPEIKIEAIPHHEMEKNQKLDKIKLKLTKEGGHAQIIPTVSQSMHTETLSLKRSLGLSETTISEKRIKSEFSDMLHSADISINIVEPNSKPHPKQITEEVTIMKIENTVVNKPSTSEHISQMKFKEMLMKISQKPDITCIRHVPPHRDDSSSSDDVKIVEVLNDPLADPLTHQEDSSSQDVVIVNEVIDTNPFKNVQIIDAHTISDSPVQQSPKRRGRPRKNPLEVKPEIKGEDCIELDAIRPKRTCRAPAGRTPFAIKERKPRGAGRGRGSPRGARGGAKSTLQKIIKETKASRAKALKEAKALAKLEAARLSQEVVIDEITIEDTTNDTSAATPVSFEDSLKKSEVKEPEVTIEMVEPEPEVEAEPGAECTKESRSPIKEETSPIVDETSAIVEEEFAKQPDPPVAVYEDETRMSASENNSRAQTPARQDVFTVPFPEGHEESQSSVQSTATTESTKNKKGRMEICDPDSAVTTVEQVVEYSWANGGPYMLQEQIAQYLGVKSFKRKYPGLNRRPVEMQERDYIREKGLVSESMCDMGLTAVPSSEILDIMYSDFQEKYEEYRKCLRDRQAKEISNKQRAISLATTQEKNKLDFKERAIRSAQNWNSNFNKVRKENRKCCMDLQTFTVNYPSGVMQAKVPHKTSVGHYPVALVPGQYTDYWKNYNSSDLNYLPLNTVRFGPMLPNKYTYDGGQSDGSSESDSSSGSDSDSSDESMSTEDEAPPTSTPILLKTPSVQLTPLLNLPKK